MSKLLNSENFGEKLFNTLPPSYRSDDVLVNNSLKRYFQALADGGYAKVIEEINGILTLIDPDKVDASLLPILFENYGLEIFNGIPELYLRKLLPMVSELYSLKGTVTAVEYLTSIISGVKSTVEVESDFETNHSIDVRLEMDYEAEGNNGLPDRDQLLRIIKEFVPFFCDVVIVYVYMFYELGQLDVEDVEEVMSVVQSLSEQGKIYSNQTGFFPLTNTDTELNNSFVLNSRYTLDFEVDQLVKDSIKFISVDEINVEDEAEEVYNRLEELKTETLNLISDSQGDEDTSIILEAREEIESLGVYPYMCNSSGMLLNSSFILNHFREFDTCTSTILDVREESANLVTIQTKDLLNMNHVELNSDFILNSSKEVDEVFESITLQVQKEVFSVSCNDLTENLNISILQEEVSTVDSDGETLSDNAVEVKAETGVMSVEASTLIGMTLFTLNTSFYTNGCSDYDKVTQSGETRVIFSI